MNLGFLSVYHCALQVGKGVWCVAFAKWGFARAWHFACVALHHEDTHFAGARGV
jgi:hypothetical protein